MLNILYVIMNEVYNFLLMVPHKMKNYLISGDLLLEIKSYPSQNIKRTDSDILNARVFILKPNNMQGHKFNPELVINERSS